jgi:hypothetical protein
MKLDSLLKGLRQDSRYAELLQKMHLPRSESDNNFGQESRQLRAQKSVR